MAARGTIAGTAIDNTGAVIADVTNTLTRTATTGSRVSKSNGKGQSINPWSS
ncbi:MAG TPA: hypothetical protein VGS20_04715 [Candidatus Acidoferrales bacterium]|nr:hypothetical protein [Candidatus Acidoferrales bacterium]